MIRTTSQPEPSSSALSWNWTGWDDWLPVQLQLNHKFESASGLVEFGGRAFPAYSNVTPIPYYIYLGAISNIRYGLKPREGMRLC